ncbi:acetylxylan esterase [Humisphaera borealis]|nr:acetylxylan esterase [Humisphaera borealis]
MLKRVHWLALLVLLGSSSVGFAQTLTATPVKPSGVYAPGEAIEWRVEAKGNAATTAPATVNYHIKKGGLTVIKQGKLELKEGVATLSATLDEPGNLLVEFTLPGVMGPDKKPIRALAGAIVAPDKIQPSAPTPEDFDSFWAGQIKAMSAIPANPKLEAAAAKATKDGRPPFEYFKLTMDSINGTHLYGQLARPKKAGRFPALLLVQYAGVYGLPSSNVVRRAEDGWLCLNIMAHDLPFDKDEAFYKEQSNGPLKDYVRIGNEDRLTSYFLRMYLNCYRAAEYLAAREDWDGKTLVVMGTSQGGGQSFAAAGLHPKVTAMLANVPAGCDLTGDQAGRAPGWPNWPGQSWGRDKAKVVAASRYFCATNFARNIKCPVMVSAGLIDETCPPAGIAASVNATQGKKELIVLPLSNHHGTGNAQAAFYVKSEKWLWELLNGK